MTDDLLDVGVEGAVVEDGGEGLEGVLAHRAAGVDEPLPRERLPDTDGSNYQNK